MQLKIIVLCFSQMHKLDFLMTLLIFPIVIDARFLLAFLRVGKFSQLSARERLANYLSKSLGSFTFLGNDPGDPKNLEILRE